MGLSSFVPHEKLKINSTTKAFLSLTLLIKDGPFKFLFTISRGRYILSPEQISHLHKLSPHFHLNYQRVVQVTVNRVQHALKSIFM